VPHIAEFDTIAEFICQKIFGNINPPPSVLCKKIPGYQKNIKLPKILQTAGSSYN
jgi:hypothetical protein